MMQLFDAGSPRLQPSADLTDLTGVLDGLPAQGAQAAVRDRMRAFAGAHPDALWRTCTEGHFTGSAVVVDAAGSRILLLFHTKHQRWLQPGGHADGDANLASVALREATEETGIAGLRIDPVPLDLDIHAIGARSGEPAHVHLDVRFVVVAPSGAEPAGNHESQDLAWFRPDQVSGLGLDADTHRLLHRGVERARVLINPR